MPAFTFEKISPPMSPGPVSPIEKNPPANEKKQRGVIVQIVGRLVERRAQRVDTGITARRERRDPK
jgi:hypothetical protein